MDEAPVYVINTNLKFQYFIMDNKCFSAVFCIIPLIFCFDEESDF